MKSILTTVACLTLATLSTFGVTRYVTQTGAGTKNGTSWSNAYGAASLQTAINACTSGDEVWVGYGTFYTTSGTDRTVSFSMKNGVSIYGNFVGTETSLAQRIMSNGLFTTLSAEIGAAGNSDNSYHVISNKNLNNTATIDGFVISGGNDNRPATTENSGLGGGIYNDGAFGSGMCNPTIRNCVITNNQATFGGGVFNNGQLGGNANPYLINCVLTSNTALEGGGAMDNFGLGGTANPTLVNCVIYLNSALLRGGAMYCWGGNNGKANPLIVNCTVIGNSAQDGGGFICDNQNSSTGNSGTATPTFKNCIVRSNTASKVGPQFFILGTASCAATYTNIDLTGQTGVHILSGATTGNISDDPKFVMSTTGPGNDGRWYTGDDGLVLRTGSACIDKGDNTGAPEKDILQKPRINNAKVDMGAYEYYSEAGIHETTKISTVTVYPNPSNGLVYLKDVSVGATIRIVNSLGQEIVNTEYNGSSLDIENLSEGTYYLTVLEKNATVKGGVLYKK